MTYYLRLGDDFLILDAHTDIEVTRNARTTSHPTHRKTSASDNYIVDNPTARYNGYVSDVQSPSSENADGAGKYVDKIKSFIDTHTPVKFKHRLDGVEEDNWFITSFSNRQDNDYGYGGTKQDGTIVQSFYISVGLEQIQPAQGAVIDIRVPTAYIDGLQQKKNTTASTVGVSEAPSTGIADKKDKTLRDKRAEILKRRNDRVAGNTPEVVE